MASDKRVFEICNAILKSKLEINWICNGRLNYANRENLKLMKRSGCRFINYGIECFDDEILRIMNKRLTCDQIVRGVENTLNENIVPGLNIIFGNIGEDETTLRKGLEFLIKYETGERLRTIRPVTPYPGSPLYYYGIEKGFIKDVEDFYENKHLNSDLMSVNFTAISDERFYEVLAEANTILYELYCEKRDNKMKDQIYELYMKRNPNFRGFRQT